MNRHCAVEYEPNRVFVADDEGEWLVNFAADLDDPEWTLLPSIKTRRDFAACGAVNTNNGVGRDIMVIGGVNVVTGDDGDFDTVEVFNTGRMTWRTLDASRIGARISTFPFGDTYIMFGGHEGSPNNQLERFDWRTGYFTVYQNDPYLSQSKYGPAVLHMFPDYCNVV